MEGEGEITPCCAAGCSCRLQLLMGLSEGNHRLQLHLSLSLSKLILRDPALARAPDQAKASLNLTGNPFLLLLLLTRRLCSPLLLHSRWVLGPQSCSFAEDPHFVRTSCNC